jgi:protein-S-isoprenylcysteine O-methyltransferase Ste14
MLTSKQQWWKGPRGEWYVALQGVFVALIILGPKTAFGLSPWPDAVATFSSYIGCLLIALGMAMALAAALHLGDSLTPLPHPKENSKLIVTGLYRSVRHPIYCGIILMAIGWALFVHGWLTLAYAALLSIFFDIKSRREEVWLISRYPGYADYQKRVRKLIPFIY